VGTARFDRFTRSVSTLLSRRTLAATLGLGALGLPGLAEAKKHKKRKKKKITRNEFGCVDVGGFCKNSGQCCSGICSGKKDKKKCKAHNTSTCQAGQQEAGCTAEATTVPCDVDGRCDTTTGKAPYCAGDGQCFPCTKDADCVPFCGAQAACITCAGCALETGDLTACVGPVDVVCDFV
jgi:hypothetical protein